MKPEKRQRKKERARRPGWFAKMLTLLPASCALLYPLYLAAQLDLVRDTYESPLLPEAFNGLTAVYISDIHYGSLLKRERVEELARRVNALSPDLILMGGDYGEDSQGALEFFEVLPPLTAKYAVLAVVGNHDRTVPESNLQKLQDVMRKHKIIPLVNDVWKLEKEGASMAFAGVDDVFNGYPDLNKVKNLCKNADFTVFLPHNPDLLPITQDMGVFYQLALCGHTHGGQVALLGHSIHSSADTGDRYRSGWYKENGIDIMVSNGVGTSGLPVRLGARPQMHLITFQKNTKK